MTRQQITILAGMAVVLAACTQRQAEVDDGGVEPGAADTTTMADTATAPVEIPQSDTGMTPVTPPATGDTAVTIDTASATGGMSDTAMTQMGDTTPAAAGGDVASSH